MINCRRLHLANAYRDKLGLLLRKIDATDRQIYRLVYDLYDLAVEEIKIVEKDTAS